MKATGEVMSIGRTFEESFLKSVRSLEIGVNHILIPKYRDVDTNELLNQIKTPTEERVFIIGELLNRGISVEQIVRKTKIDLFFVDKWAKIIKFDQELRSNSFDPDVYKRAKRINIGDAYIADCWGSNEIEVYKFRQLHKVYPVYKMIDTCASEFDSYVPYFYSTYEEENESIITKKEKVIVLGSGPIRIGQGVEFDYSTVHAIWAIHDAGYEAIVINNNPETVSTDYTVSDKLYFEPLVIEDVMNIIELEKPKGVIVTLGGSNSD